MPDLKISAMTAASPIVSTDVFPFVRGGANFRGTALNLATYIYTQSNTEVIALAALQAKAIAGTIVPMRMYVTTISAGYNIYLLGASTTTVNTSFQYGQIRTAAMSASVFGIGQYDLVTGTLLEFTDPVKGNHAIGSAAAIATPFDNPDFEDNSISGTVTFGAGCTCKNNIFTAGSDVTFGAGCDIQNATIDHKTVVFPAGYTSTSPAYYGPLGSTFVCSAQNDLDGQTNIRFDNWPGGGDFSFCGIFTDIDNNGAAVTIDSAGLTLTDHDILLLFDTVANPINFIIGGGTSTYPFFLSGSVSPLIISASGDRLGLSFSSTLSGLIQNGNTFTQ